MPIFEYQCSKCEHIFEKLVMGPDSEKALACPECRSRKVDKLFSGFAARSKSAGGQTRSLSSGCSGCRASSCAGCR